ncbi:Neuronal acetylcholine receptor subunit alpha-9 [Holothuria leucospilota]|uniref:Neuronal acetylcholine receptor subunit alpha-9 n=1 Tax=Holothuria leucospilota TaxID=206669 RepID=A0A9Q1BH49_HOLLE|nr:Neuronal acetylcholine receptor subunit alpha-9 [Holothuria leucospilota]
MLLVYIRRIMIKYALSGVKVLMDTTAIYLLLSVCLLHPVTKADPRTVKLHQDLFETYHADVRPVVNSTTIVYLNFQFFIFNILDMDERSQTLSCSTWLTLIWYDEYLTWDPSDYGGLKKTKVSSNSIWLPDLYFYQNADAVYHNFLRDTMVKVDYDGQLLWASPVNFRSFCRLDVRYFPFDQQDCEMKFGPWSHDGNELVINGSGDMSAFIGNGEWDIVNIDAMNNKEYYPDDPGVPYHDVTFTVHFQRRSQFYVFNLIMPATLITLMASLAFLLPPTSQGKINLGTTFMLSKTVFLMIVAESMPPTDEVPVLGQYLATLMVLVSLSLVLNVSVVMIYNKGLSGEPLKPWIRTFIHKILAPIVLIHVPGQRKVKKEKYKPKRLNNSKLSPTRYPNVAFSQLKTYSSRYGDNEQVVLNGNRYGGKYSMVDNGHSHSTTEQAVIVELKRMNELLTSIKQDKGAAKQLSSKSAGTTNDSLKEWILVTRVLDRIFFTFYVLACILASVYLVITIHVF